MHPVLRYFLLFLILCFSIPAAFARSAVDMPSLASVNAAVAYAGENELIVGKNADRPVPIASITKLMTALVVMDSGQALDEWLEFRERHKEAPANAYTRIRVGSEMKRGDMLRIALMSSENFAAYTLARHYPGGYQGFVQAMNDKAAELGMTHTRFVDPTGLSTGNIASAADLVKLVNATARHPEIGEYSTTRYFTGRFRQPRYSLRFGNTNRLVHRKSWGVGISKTGYLDEAGRCLVMTSEMHGRRVVTVFLDSLGTLSPLGDAGRVKRWLANGASGQVAPAAREYAQKKNQAYQSRETRSAGVSVN
ncbi:D-alanyl-D-alanine endopeptidase [Marinobacter sp.]|uniref:D-alanyl-D-alanine endopeptidase n=1 Tax=Marinobacter sp. TaxID=50741 RepID=UPI00198F8896|nr:D-alanyl-D-alanine endopeptidase [Marinobacter sp.]MBC7191249.1 D-alanyl-D-alanine endopeptidase [Marinobacter sp.]